MKKAKSTAELISELSQESKARWWRGAKIRFVAWLLLSLLLAFLLVFFSGIKFSPTEQESGRVYLEMLFLGLLSLYSAWMSIELSRPVLRLSAWVRWAPIVGLVAWAILPTQSLIRAWIANDPAVELMPYFGLGCAKEVFLLAIVPASALLYFVGMGSCTLRKRAGFMALLASASLAALLTQLSCPTSQASHILLWHFAPVLVLSFLGGFVGLRFIRW